MSDLDEQQDGGFEEPTAPAWMATFSDLVTLLLTLLVACFWLGKFGDTMPWLGAAHGQRTRSAAQYYTGRYYYRY